MASLTSSPGGSSQPAATPAAIHSPVRWQPIAVFAIFAALSARLLLLVSRYAVNVFFMDQWDFNDATLFQQHSLWGMFRWQHGPHRQGLGALVSYFVEPYFHWSSRADAFLAAVLIILAAACALFLKRRLFGPLQLSDICIPMIFVTVLQYEAVFITANLTQGPLPLLLILFYCLAWTVPARLPRYSLVLLINFVAIHTGYCFFLGFLTLALLLIEYLSARAHPLAIRAFLFGELVALASFGLFLYGYVFTTEVDCAPNLFSSPASYARFLLLLYANLFGAKGVGFFPLLVGLLTLAAILAALSLNLRPLAPDHLSDQNQGHKPRTIAILVAFSLLFSLNAAYARSCLGPQVAQFSRYVIWMEPGLFGLYLLLYALRSSVARTAALGILSLALLSTIPIRSEDKRSMEFVATAKRNWRSCYLQTEEISRCNHAVGYGVYPAVTPQLKSKLGFLKQSKLNLYSTE